MNTTPEEVIRIPKKVKVVRIPFPVLDFLIWTKYLTYVCVDIRDTTGRFAWNGKRESK